MFHGPIKQESRGCRLEVVVQSVVAAALKNNTPEGCCSRNPRIRLGGEITQWPVFFDSPLWVHLLLTMR